MAKFIAGVNDLASKYPDIAKEWSSKNSLRADEIHFGSHSHCWFTCSVCGYERTQEVRNRTVYGQGCAACAGRVIIKGYNDLASKRPDLAKEWSSRNELKPDEVLWTHQKKYWFICPDCGYERLQQVYARTINKQNCGVCSGQVFQKGINDLETKRPDLAAEWSPQNTLRPDEVFWRKDALFWFICPDCGYERQQNLYKRADRGDACPSCAGQAVFKGYNDLATLRPDLAREWDRWKNRDEFDEQLLPEHFTKGSHYRAHWYHWVNEDKHEWEAAISDRACLGRNCPHCCNERTRSLLEIELYKEVTSWLPAGEVESAWRGLGLEIDVWIPSKKTGIEFNGIYWHSERFAGKTRHFEKYKKCKEAGITLLQVWEDDWVYRRDQVLLGLKRKLGISSEERLSARDLTLFGLEVWEAQDFLNQWHIQGSTGGKLKLGLLDKGGEIRTAAVFKDKGNGVLSLERYATNAIVRGGLGKTLSYVRKKYPNYKIETFADHAWSDGGLYETLGFERAYEIDPDYKYVVGDKREHKFNYRLERFKTDPQLKWEEGLTEKELAQLNGLERIWDAGKTKYLLGVK